MTSTPAPCGGDALTDDERRMFDAEFVRDYLGRTTDIGYGDRNRIAWHLVDYFAAHADQPGTPTALTALADQWEASLKVTFHTDSEARIVAEHVAQLRTLAGDPA